MTSRKLRSKKETQEYWRVEPRGWRPYALVQGAEKEALIARIQSAAKNYRNHVDTYAESLAPVKRANPWMSNSTAVEVVSLLMGAIENGESEWFARHALNGFLNETNSQLIFGDWVEEHREELLERCESLEVLQTPHFDKIFMHTNDYVFSDSPVLLRSGASKMVYNALAELTLADVRTVYGSPIGREKTQASSVETKIEAILAAHRGAKVELPKFKEVERKLRRAFVTLFVSEPDSNLDNLETATLLVEKELRRVHKASYSNPLLATYGDASTAELETFADWLLANASSFRFYHFMVLLHSLRNPATLIKRPPEGTRSVLAIYSEVIAKADDPVTTLKNIAQIVIAVKTERPSFEAWIEGVQDGTVEGSLDPRLTSVLLADGDSKAPVFQELSLMRRSLNHFLRS